MKNDRLVEVYKGMYLYKIGSKNIESFSNFVYEKYVYHYHKKYNWNPEESVQKEMNKADANQYENSVYYGFRDAEGNFLGTMKVGKKGNEELSIEKDFNIQLDELITKLDFSVGNVWHLGRLAIASEILKRDFPLVSSKEVIQNLLLHSLSHIAKNDDDIMLAESDVLIHKIFDELGLHMEIIGEKKYFLGSPTYPVMLTAKTIQNWLANHMAFSN